MDGHLDWYTTKILEDGSQVIHIRPTLSKDPKDILELDRDETFLLMALLDEIAKDHTLPWSEARQAILRGFKTALQPPV